MPRDRKVVDLPERVRVALESYKREHPELSDRDALDALYFPQTPATVPPADSATGGSSGITVPEVIPSSETPLREPGNLGGRSQRELVEYGGETYVPCIYGAYTVDSLEVYPTVQLRTLAPAKCPFLTENPRLPLNVLNKDYCKKSKEAERCPVLSDWTKWLVLEGAAKLKQQQYREKLAALPPAPRGRKDPRDDLEKVRAFHQQEYRARELRE